MERRGVQGDSVRHFVKRNEFADEGLTRGGIHRGDRSRDKRQNILMPQLPRSCQDDETHDERDNADASLRALQETPPRDTVREHARPRGEQDDRQELQGGDDADLRGIVVGEDREHVPVLSHAL